MIIENESRTRQITIIKSDEEKVYYPSYQVGIEFKTENLAGSYNNFIWIRRSDIQTFLGQLHELDQKRKGSAELQSMSHDEFRLTFKAVDDLGHLAVQLELEKKNRINNDYGFKITIEFETDPTILPRIGTELKLLMNE